jgi:tetratricopeptide (TPR) repeat protein
MSHKLIGFWCVALALVGLLCCGLSRGQDSDFDLDAYKNLLDDILGRHDFERSESFLRREYERTESEHGADSLEFAGSAELLALIYQIQKKYELAEPLHRRALAIKEKAYGRDFFGNQLIHDNLAKLYRDQGKFDDAENSYKRSLEIEEKYPPNGSGAASALRNLGNLYIYEKKYGEAEPLLERALSLGEQQWGPDSFFVALNVVGLADLYAAQERFDLAEPLYVRSVALYDKAKGVSPRHLAKLYEKVAAMYKHLGREEEAKEYSNRAAETRGRLR